MLPVHKFASFSVHVLLTHKAQIRVKSLRIYAFKTCDTCKDGFLLTIRQVSHGTAWSKRQKSHLPEWTNICSKIIFTNHIIHY